MRRILAAAGIAAAAVVGLTTSAQAQGRRMPPRSEMRGASTDAATPDRAELQRQVRQAMARAAREKVGLTDEQMARLAPVNAKYAKQRRALATEERSVRVALRRAMLDTANIDQTKIAGYQDQLLDLQRKRLDIVGAEQKELSTFMTPLQLAKYRALQEELRRRADEMRRQGPPRRGTNPFGTAPDSSH